MSTKTIRAEFLMVGDHIVAPNSLEGYVSLVTPLKDTILIRYTDRTRATALPVEEVTIEDYTR